VYVVPHCNAVIGRSIWLVVTRIDSGTNEFNNVIVTNLEKPYVAETFVCLITSVNQVIIELILPKNSLRIDSAVPPPKITRPVFEDHLRNTAAAFQLLGWGTEWAVRRRTDWSLVVNVAVVIHSGCAKSRLWSRPDIHSPR
jgi:hypothetical protein